jgi:putative membrane protein insertion efficiency factor
MRTIVLALIRTYRYLLSPWWGRHCRFEPTCSAYALEAVERHGCIRGALFTSRRLLCCHPWHRGGFDPVP